MGTLEILERYLPDYHRNDNVARMDDLSKWLNAEMEEDEQKEKGLLCAPKSEVFDEFLELQDKLMSRALQNLIKQNETLLEACKTTLEDTQMLLDGECDFSEDNLQATIDHLKEAIEFTKQ